METEVVMSSRVGHRLREGEGGVWGRGSWRRLLQRLERMENRLSLTVLSTCAKRSHLDDPFIALE